MGKPQKSGLNMAEEDPIKLHKEGTTLADKGKYKEAAEKFIKASELYNKLGNFFDASYMIFKAGECNFMLKEYKPAVERFLKSADIAFEKGFDRFGVGALEYARDCYKALKNKKEEAKLNKKIKELKAKLAEAF
jgi:tetratricopeptide (TPR) repeat protein